MRGSNGRTGQACIGLVLCGLLAAVALGCQGCAPISYHRDEYASSWISDYDYLSRYGEWIRLPRYDLVWRPYVVAGWAPFQHGHWVWTNDGWAWVSYEPFGQLVYHYGYWDYSLRFGWVWVPDTVWWPARVQWYTFGNYCAWAPLPPPHMTWPDPWDYWDVNVWVVVHIDHFTSDDVGKHRIGEPIRRDVVQRDDVARRPPSIERVEERTQRTIPVVRIEREQIEVRREVIKPPTTHTRAARAPLSRMVLPERERDKVREHAPQIEREVLVPRRTEPEKRREQPEAQPQRREPEARPERRETEAQPQRREPEKQPETQGERGGTETRSRTRTQ